MTARDTKLRADAKTNRDRVLAVARDALAADPTTSLNAIGKAAGVGAGTLYRHFPTREALVLGVYRKEVDALVAMAPALLAERPPLEAFRIWCERFLAHARIKHGISDALRAAMSYRDLRETYWPMVEAVRELLAACDRSGEVQVDLDAEDVTQLLGCLLHIAPTVEGEARMKRLLSFILRGLGVATAPEGRRS